MNNVLVLGVAGHHEIFSDMFKTEEIQHKHLFDTKYYQSEVYFHCYSLNEKLDNELLSKTQSLLFYIDSFDTFKLIQSLHDFLSTYNLDTKVCVVDKKLVNHQVVQEWCVDNSYELIDLKETGIKRIFEAIECTMWPVMELKKKEPKIVSKQEVIEKKLEKLEQETQVEPEFEKEKQIMEKYFENLKDGNDFDDVGDQEEHDIDSILKDMMALKMNTQNLSADERKEKAAKIAMLLFSSLGGDEE